MLTCYRWRKKGELFGVTFSLKKKKTAHDKVWHAGLLRKLEALGVQSKLLQWFESYLRNRKPRVVIEGQG